MGRVTVNTLANNATPSSASPPRRRIATLPAEITPFSRPKFAGEVHDLRCHEQDFPDLKDLGTPFTPLSGVSVARVLTN